MLPGETVLSGAKGATTADFRVMKSHAGFYVGTERDGYPYTRETKYFATHDAALDALNTFRQIGWLPGAR